MTSERLTSDGIASEPPSSQQDGFSSEESYPQYVPYVVQPDDTLSGIAVRHFGDGNRYLDIYEANRDSLAHPDALQVGQTIRIPAPGRRNLQMASGESEFPR